MVNYNHKKPLKAQMEAVKHDPGMMKYLLDDYIVETLHKHTGRDMRLLDLIKTRTDEKAMLQQRKEAQDKASELYKRVVRRLDEDTNR